MGLENIELRRIRIGDEAIEWLNRMYDQATFDAGPIVPRQRARKGGNEARQGIQKLLTEITVKGRRRWGSRSWWMWWMWWARKKGGVEEIAGSWAIHDEGVVAALWKRQASQREQSFSWSGNISWRSVYGTNYYCYAFPLQIITFVIHFLIISRILCEFVWGDAWFFFGAFLFIGRMFHGS